MTALVLDTENLAERTIAQYFEQLAVAYEQASNISPPQHRHLVLAGNHIAMSCSGGALFKTLLRALNHLSLAADHGPGPALAIMGWNQAASGIPLPAPPWNWPQKAPNHDA